MSPVVLDQPRVPTQASDVIGVTDPTGAANGSHKPPTGAAQTSKKKKKKSEAEKVSHGAKKKGPAKVITKERVKRQQKPSQTTDKKETKKTNKKATTEKDGTAKSTEDGPAVTLTWEGVDEKLKEMHEDGKKNWKKRVYGKSKGQANKMNPTYVTKKIRKYIATGGKKDICMSSGRIGRMGKFVLQSMLESKMLPSTMSNSEGYRLGEAARIALANILEIDMIEFVKTANAVRYASRRSKFARNDFVCAE